MKNYNLKVFKALIVVSYEASFFGLFKTELVFTELVFILFYHVFLGFNSQFSFISRYSFIIVQFKS